MLRNSPESLASPDWRPVQLRLPFRLGELQLFSRSLLGVTHVHHFLNRSTKGLPPLPDAAGCDHDFLFVQTYPVDEPPAALRKEQGWLVYTPYTFRNYFIDLRKCPTFDAYLAHFSSKSRSTLKRKVRKFADACGGSIDFRVFATPHAMEEFLGHAYPLSAKTYQDRLLNSGLPTSASFRTRLNELATAGDAIGALLFARGCPIAYMLCLRQQGILTYDYVGFDPAAEATSPGTVLLYLFVEYLIESRIAQYFDFTEGEGEHKRQFGTGWTYCAKSYCFKPTFANIITARAHQGLDRLSSAVGRALDRLGLKTRLRAWLRQPA